MLLARLPLHGLDSKLPILEHHCFFLRPYPPILPMALGTGRSEMLSARAMCRNVTVEEQHGAPALLASAFLKLLLVSVSSNLCCILE